MDQNPYQFIENEFWDFISSFDYTWQSIEELFKELGVTITKVEKELVEVGSGGSIYKFDKARNSHLTVWMTVKNHSATKRITFYGWSNDLFGDERQLRDEFDNAYSIEDLSSVATTRNCMAGNCSSCARTSPNHNPFAGSPLRFRSFSPDGHWRASLD